MAKRRRKKAGLWRRRFLKALARTANAGLSADMAGVDRTTAYLLRGRDPGFAAAWVRARAWGRARVKAEGRPVFANGRPRAAPGGAAPDLRELVIRTSKNGGTQIVRAGEGRWTPSAEAGFFAHLAAGYGVRRSAKAAGFSTNAVYERRKLNAGFAAQWEEAKEQGLARNDILLIDSVQWTLDAEAVEAAEDLPRPTIAEAIQIVRLYRRAGDGAGRRRRYGPKAPSIEEVRDEVLRRLEAIRRHRAERGGGEDDASGQDRG